ncbi:MAG TPA: hypothetical protein VFU71_09320, partial [Burkholderiaceae bacterium]|nr:hypothetical protein [Burkholderiaceae bacterium]
MASLSRLLKSHHGATRRTPLKALISLAALGALVACGSLSAPGADTVYVNGNIITVDKTFSIAQAVAVKNGRFAGVGTSDQ